MLISFDVFFIRKKIRKNQKPKKEYHIETKTKNKKQQPKKANTEKQK